MAGSVTIRKTSAGVAVTVRVAAIRSALDTVLPPLAGLSERLACPELRIPLAEMAEAHDTWQHAVKSKLQRLLRERLVQGLGGTMPKSSPRGSPTRTGPPLYPTLPYDLRTDVDGRPRAT